MVLNLALMAVLILVGIGGLMFSDPDESDQDDPRPRWSVTRDLRSRSWTAIGCGLFFGAVAFVQIIYRLLMR